MRLSAEELTQPISEDQPCGEDLEYDPAFQQMETLLQTKPEQEFGDTIIPAEGPDWKGVEKQAADLIKRTCDLRVLANVAIAQLHTSGLVAFANAMNALNACMETFWDSIYPELDVEDNNDATMRYNALQILNDHNMVCEGLVRSPLVVLKGVGGFSLHDIELAEGKTKPVDDEEVHDLALILGAFGEASADEMTTLGESVRNSITELQRTQSLWDQLAENAPDLDLQDTLKVLNYIREAMANYAPAAAAASSDDENGEIGDDEVQGTVKEKSISGSINDRNDVVRAIDKICEFYTANEPSSPVPLLLRRAQRLVSMSFVEILEDIGPDGVSQVKHIGGIKD